MSETKGARNRRERERASLRRIMYHPSFYGSCEFCPPDCDGAACNGSCREPMELKGPGGKSVTVVGDLVWDHRDKTTKRRSIARMMGNASDASIEAELKKCRVLCRHHNSTGERNGANTLRPSQVAEIRRRSRSGESTRTLARVFACSERTVIAIKNEETWPEETLQAALDEELGDERIY